MNEQQIGWLKRLDEVIDTLAELRVEIAGPESIELGGVPTVPPATSQDVLNTIRALRFLKAFYDAPGHSLHKDAANAAAKSAGYDPRGTAGFYVGNGSLARIGDYRILTEVGQSWYEQHAPAHEDELDAEE